MKKFIGLILLVLNCSILFSCDGNVIDDDPKKEPPVTDHIHTFSNEWDYDETYHFHKAICEHTTEKSDVAKHSFDEWQNDKGKKTRKCNICHYVQEEEIPLDLTKINDLIDNLKMNNYTVEILENEEYHRYAIVNTNYRIYELNDRLGRIFTIEQEKSYSYTYSKTDSKWHKNILDFQFTVDHIILTDLVNAKVTKFDYETEVYFITMDEEEFTLSIGENSVNFSSANKEVQISCIGTTTLGMPDSSDIIDDTIVTPPEPDTPIVDEEYIYKIDEKGNYEFNIVLMKEILEQWMKGDNQFGKDVLAEKYYNDTLVSERIYYIDASKEKIEMGLLARDDKYSSFGIFRLNDTALFESLENGEYQSKGDFVRYLNSIKKTKYSLKNEIVIDEKFAEMNKNCDTIADNIFRKLVNTGYQSRIDAEGIKVLNFTNIDSSKIIFGFKNESSDTFPGYGLGNIKEWSLYLLLLNNDENLEFIQIDIVASLSNGAENEYENILKDIDKTWLIRKIERTTIDNCNKIILDEISSDHCWYLIN